MNPPLDGNSLVISTLDRVREHTFVRHPAWDFVIIDECLSVQNAAAKRYARPLSLPCPHTLSHALSRLLSSSLTFSHLHHSHPASLSPPLILSLPSTRTLSLPSLLSRNLSIQFSQSHILPLILFYPLSFRCPAAWRQIEVSVYGCLMLSATFFRSKFDSLFYMIRMLRSPLPRTMEYLPVLIKEHIVCEIPGTLILS